MCEMSSLGLWSYRRALIIAQSIGHGYGCIGMALFAFYCILIRGDESSRHISTERIDTITTIAGIV